MIDSNVDLRGATAVTGTRIYTSVSKKKKKISKKGKNVEKKSFMLWRVTSVGSKTNSLCMVRTYVCESQISLKTHSPVVTLTKQSPTVAETPRDSVIAQTICCAPPRTVEPAVRGRPVLGRGPELGMVGVPLPWGLHTFLGGISERGN